MYKNLKKMVLFSCSMGMASVGVASKSAMPSPQTEIGTHIVMGGDCNSVVSMATAMHRSDQLSEKNNEPLSIFTIFVDSSVSLEQKKLLQESGHNVEVQDIDDWLKIQQPGVSQIHKNITIVQSDCMGGTKYTEFSQNPHRLVASRFFYPVIFFGDDQESIEQAISLDYDKTFNRSHTDTCKKAAESGQSTVSTAIDMVNFSEQPIYINPGNNASVNNFNGGLLVFNKDAWVKTLQWIYNSLNDYCNDPNFENDTHTGMESQKDFEGRFQECWPKAGSFSENYVRLLTLMNSYFHLHTYPDGEKGHAFYLPLIFQKGGPVVYILIATEEQFFHQIARAFCLYNQTLLVYISSVFNANSEAEGYLDLRTSLRALLLKSVDSNSKLLALSKKYPELLTALEDEVKMAKLIQAHPEIMEAFHADVGGGVNNFSTNPFFKNFCQRYGNGGNPDSYVGLVMTVNGIINENKHLQAKEETDIQFAYKIVNTLVSELTQPNALSKKLTGCVLKLRKEYDWKRSLKAVDDAFLNPNSSLYLFKNPDRIRAFLSKTPVNTHFDQVKKPWEYNLGEECIPAVDEWVEHFDAWFKSLPPEQQAIARQTIASTPSMGTRVRGIVGLD